MTKRSPETLLAIVEMIAGGVLSQASACRACDVSVSTYWEWIGLSQRTDDPMFTLTYCGEEMRFHEAIKLARKIALTDVMGRFEQRMHAGHYEPVFFQGRPMWKEDERLAQFSDEEVH